MTFNLCKYCTRKFSCDMYEDFTYEEEKPIELEDCSYFTPVSQGDLLERIKELKEALR